MNYNVINKILVVHNQYFFDPESLIVFSKTNASDSAEEIINDFHKNKPVDSSIDDLEKNEYSNAIIELHVTDNCTFRCKYCYAEGSCQNKNQEMSEEVIEKSFRYVRNSFPNAKTFTIALFGGEPLLFFKKFPFILKKSQEIFSDRKVKITFPTNGSLINDNIADFLNKNKVAFQISWDGKEDQQNYLRPTVTGKKSYPIVNANLNRFAKITDSLSVRATITPYNLQVSDLYTFFKEKGFKRINFGICFSGPDDVVIKKEHFPQLLEEWNKLARLYLQHIVEEEVIIDFTVFQRSLHALHHGKKKYHFCGMGKNLFAFSPEGNIYSCHRFVRNEDHRIGTLSEGIDKKAQTTTNIPVTDKESCRDCFARFLCGGGCLHEQFFGSADLSCLMNRHLAALCVWIYGELSTYHPESLKKLFPDSTLALDSLAKTCP